MKNWGTMVVIMANPCDYYYFEGKAEKNTTRKNDETPIGIYKQAMKTISGACALLPVVVVTPPDPSIWITDDITEKESTRKTIKECNKDYVRAAKEGNATLLNMNGFTQICVTYAPTAGDTLHWGGDHTRGIEQRLRVIQHAICSKVGRVMMAETTLITAMSTLPRLSNWNDHTEEVSRLTFEEIQREEGEEETIKGNYTKTTKRKQMLAKWYTKEGKAEKVKKEMRCSKEILRKIRENGEFAVPTKELQMEIRAGSFQRRWETKEEKGDVDVYLRTPTIVTIEQRSVAAEEGKWKGSEYSIYETPNLEIYLGKGELSECGKLKEIWEEVKKSEEKEIPNTADSNDDQKKCELCNGSARVRVCELGCLKSLCRNCTMMGACCPCMKEDEEKSGKDQKQRKDGMIRCATSREENDNGEVEISEGMGNLPLGGKTIGQLVAEAKEKAGAELRWWDQGDHNSEVTKNGNKLTIKKEKSG